MSPRPRACLRCPAFTNALRLAGASASRPKRAYAPECSGTQVRRTLACRRACALHFTERMFRAVKPRRSGVQARSREPACRPVRRSEHEGGSASACPPAASGAHAGTQAETSRGGSELLFLFSWGRVPLWSRFCPAFQDPAQ